jgi:hypothetical protein
MLQPSWRVTWPINVALGATKAAADGSGWGQREVRVASIADKISGKGPKKN